MFDDSVSVAELIATLQQQVVREQQAAARAREERDKAMANDSTGFIVAELRELLNKLGELGDGE